MKSGEIRADLLNKIEHMSAAQLRQFYGYMQNFFNANDSEEEWEKMSAEERQKIDMGISSADAGKVKPLEKVLYRLRKKYGLNG